MRVSDIFGSFPSRARASIWRALFSSAAQKKPTLDSGALFTPKMGVLPTLCDAPSKVPSPPTATTRAAPSVSVAWARRTSVMVAPAVRAADHEIDRAHSDAHGASETPSDQALPASVWRADRAPAR
jgi:hypothetical protein